MRVEHLYDVELSLLVALHVLLEEGSVTRAARRLGRSQPAVSRALARLRELLGDPLLVREGTTLVPTPRAEALREPLRRILQALDREVLAPPDFDPATATRTFTIVSADFAEAMLLPRPLARLSREAPGVDVVLGSARVGQSTADVLREGVDLAVAPLSGDDAQIRSVRAGTEGFLCLLRAGHPDAERLDVDAYCRLPHVLAAPGGTPGGVVDVALARIGRSRRVAIRTRRFSTVPQLVAQTDAVATLPSRFAAAQARALGLVILPPPIELPPFDLIVAWHERWQHDPGHRFVRQVVVEELRSVLA